MNANRAKLRRRDVLAGLIATPVLLAACAPTGQAMTQAEAAPPATATAAMSPTTGMDTAPAPGATSPAAAEPAATMAPKAAGATFVPYSPEALAAATASGRTILYFHADWCPTCRAADADFEANRAQLPADLTVLVVDYDRETALKGQHKIAYQHTFVQIDGSGQEITRWSGGGTRDLLANLR